MRNPFRRDPSEAPAEPEEGAPEEGAPEDSDTHEDETTAPAETADAFADQAFDPGREPSGSDTPDDQGVDGVGAGVEVDEDPHLAEELVADTTDDSYGPPESNTFDALAALGLDGGSVLRERNGEAAQLLGLDAPPDPGEAPPDEARDEDDQGIEVVDGCTALVIDEHGDEVIARLRVLPDSGGALIADELDPASGTLLRVFDPVDVVRVVRDR